MNVHKTFRRRSERRLSGLCAFNLRPVRGGNLRWCHSKKNVQVRGLVKKVKFRERVLESQNEYCSGVFIVDLEQVFPPWNGSTLKILFKVDI